MKSWLSQHIKLVVAAPGFLMHQTEDSGSLFPLHHTREKCGETLLASVELRQSKVGFGPLISVRAQIAGTDAFLSDKDRVFNREQENEIKQ